ncbi:helix-turn-helix domain-containing protein [Vallitalea longa]|uniref:helix-turn-helix domain-containing protein n=1 Tax=Vallitalea longa TaxID=2936439 RepID=UPI00249281D5|nr:helix-turn-helix transcriptional regulator [Vallitalea longa]
MNVLEKIQELCKEREINPSRLEIELGFGKGTLYKWSKSVPKSDKLEKVANYFKVSIDYLLDRGNLYDIGEAIKGEREYQGYSIEELSELIGVKKEKLNEYEENLVPISECLLKKISKIFDMTVHELLDKYNIYDECIPPQFNGDINKYEAFKKTRDKDATKEDKIKTIAAHTMADLTEEERNDVIKYVEFIKSKRDK